MAQAGFTVEATSDVLLDYAVRTAPEPLQVSPGIGEINIVVSNGGEATVTCSMIEISVPIGTIARALTDNPGSIKLAARPSSQWAFDPPNPSDPGTFIVRPTKPQYGQFTVDTTLYLQIYSIEVNAEIGTFELDVVESSAPGTDTTTPRQAAWKIPKFPYGFTVSDFRPNAPQVNDGQPVTLKWNASESPEATLTILYGQNAPVDVTKVITWTTRSGLHQDTTFILDAAVQYDGGTVHHYLTTTVTVLNPDLTAGSVHVLEATQLDGTTSVGTSGSPSSLAVNGALTATGPASVGGQLRAQSASIEGGLSTQSATIGGGLIVSGLLNALGPIAFRAVGAAQRVALGSYGPAPTDGFVIGLASAEGIHPTTSCIGWLNGFCNGILVWATGGNLYGPGLCVNFAASFVLPVPKGATWSVGYQPGNADAEPVITCWWVPLGNAVGIDGPQRIGDWDVEAIAMVKPHAVTAPCPLPAG